MSFQKKYVLVESLVIERAMELKREAGFPNLYLSYSCLLKEDGLAQALANYGSINSEGEIIMADDSRHLKGIEPQDLGLEDEVDGFLETSPYDGLGDSIYWIFRHYRLQFHDPDNHKPALSVHIRILKDTKESKWGFASEVAIKLGPDGSEFSSNTVISRDCLKKSAA